MTDVFPQAGAIPYRIAPNKIQVLLISTSSGKNRTIPKGLIDPGYSVTETALNEAYEEAGIKGRLLTPPWVAMSLISGVADAWSRYLQ
jgi:8-oxo-dGTP pyrophosphatase MutT (NUDIX family)